MRAVKLALFCVLVAAWVTGWQNRSDVVEAYTQERAPIQLRLQGLDGLVGVGSPGRSPYVLPLAADTSDSSVGVFVERPDPQPILLTGGSGKLSGFVVDPAGVAVPNATVRLVRVTSAGQVAQDVAVGAQGEWEVADLLGGRYRVRAFVPGTYRSVGSTVFVLGDGATAELVSLVAPPAQGVSFRLTGPDQLFLGQAATVAVSANREAVDSGGVLVLIPAGGLVVSVQAGVGTSLLSADTVITGADGSARYLISCDAQGVATLGVSNGTSSALLALPPCVPVPPPAEEPVAEVGEG